MTKLLTLCIIREGGSVLLGMKKRGFGAGRWNGFGGKVHDGETVEDAVRREVHEETGVTVQNVERRGIIEFRFQGQEDVLEVHIFHGSSLNGTPVETEEMRPAWFLTDTIPFDAMWPDDRYWFPLFLAGKRFRGRFLFGDRDVILQQQLSPVESL